MKDEVIALLGALGLTVSPDDPLLGFIINSVAEQIRNGTNQPEIPDGLHHMAVEMAVGYYLKYMKDSGKLDETDTDTGITTGDAVIKSIQEGDTTITYAVGSETTSTGQKLDDLIDYLINGRRGEFYRYRRLVW